MNDGDVLTLVNNLLGANYTELSNVPTSKLNRVLLLMKLHVVAMEAFKVDEIGTVHILKKYGIADDDIALMREEAATVQPAVVPDPVLFEVRAAEMDTAALGMCFEGHKIQAIKHVRKCTGWGIRESKDYVNNLVSKAGKEVNSG